VISLPLPKLLLIMDINEMLMTYAQPCGVAAMSIHSLVTSGVFDPEALASIDEALMLPARHFTMRANQK
jgi:hypothetical protein